RPHWTSLIRPDVVVAEVIAVDSLDECVLLDERRRTEVGRLLGRPCTVVRASYSLGGRCGTRSAATLSEVRAALQARGLRLGGPLEPTAEVRREPVPPRGAVEVIVRSSGERRVFPVCEFGSSRWPWLCWSCTLRGRGRTWLTYSVSGLRCSRLSREAAGPNEALPQAGYATDGLSSF